MSAGNSGCPAGTPSRCRLFRWQRKVLMNHAVVVSPCPAGIGGWEIACHSDFRAIMDCKERSIHYAPGLPAVKSGCVPRTHLKLVAAGLFFPTALRALACGERILKREEQ